jgi:hypothetical protein
MYLHIIENNFPSLSANTFFSYFLNYPSCHHCKDFRLARTFTKNKKPNHLAIKLVSRR